MNEKVGSEWYVYDMYKLLEQLDKYLKNNDLGIEMYKILEEYKKDELDRNSLSVKVMGLFL